MHGPIRPPVVRVLGPTRLADGPAPSPAGSRLLAGLVAAGSRGATVEWLSGLVWPDGAPRTSRASLQNQVTRLRERLGHDRVTWSDQRYRLHQVPTDVDTLLRLVADLDHLGVDRDPDAALAAIRQALSLFRGPPFEDLPADATRSRRRHLQELQHGLQNAEAEALVALGRGEEAAATWRQLVDASPHDEARWAGLVTALRACGRRGDALATFHEARRRLRDDLGLDPGDLLMDAHRAALRSQPPESDAGAGTTIVPRPELADLVRDALADNRIVVVVGEGGIGKTTLADTVREDRPDGRTLRIACLDNSWTPLQPVQDLVTALRGRLDRLDPPPGPATRGLLARPTLGGTDTAPLGLVTDVTDAVVRAVRDEPVTLVLDDAGHAGPTTWRVVQTVLEHHEHLRLVATTREPDTLPVAVRQAATLVDVPGLDVAQVDTLVGQLLRRPGRVTPLARWAHAATGGNPLFVTELIAELERTDALTVGPHGVEPPTTYEVPPQLQHVIGQRIGSVRMRSRRALDALAVLGEADDALLHDLGATSDDLDEPRHAGLVLHQGEQWRFAHDLLRSTALDLVPHGRRIELRLAAAEALEDRGAAAGIVATHRIAIGEVDAPAAATAALRAATQAVASQAFGEAVTWTERGLAVLADSGPAGRHVAVELAVVGADARRLAGAVDHAPGLLAAAEQALELDDPDLRRRAVLACLRLGACCQPGDEQAQAVTLADRALAMEPDAGGRALLHASASLTHSMVDPDASRAHFRSAMELVDGLAAESHLLVEILPYAYMGLGLPEDLLLRDAATTRLAEAAQELDDPVARFEAAHLRFSVALQRGDRTGLEAARDEMGRLSSRVADVGRRWSLAYVEATLHQVAGELDEAERGAQAALEVGLTVAASRATAAWAAQMLEVRRLQGRLGELAPLITGMAQDPTTLPAWRAAAALVLTAEDRDTARTLVTDLCADLSAFPRDFARGAALVTLGRAVVRLEAGEQAGVLLGALQPWVRLLSWQGTTTYGPYGEVVADLAHLVGDEDAAAAARARAHAATASLHSPVYGARTTG